MAVDFESSFAFQSTLPIQGETRGHEYLRNNLSISIHSPYTGRDLAWMESADLRPNFNPLSLYRERPTANCILLITVEISIHSPYTGRDSNFAHKTPNIQPILLCKTPNKRTFSNTYTTNYNFPSPHIINIQVRISLHFHVHFTFALNHSRI